ncbi:unnamed protein product [Echinostoma caproni]|uniref:SAC domain-containing protein n=1 Tax=Echinostoma caproni TaxID=27848 RepID=A0A183BDU9_9TREM|nr:unnamed protein product [Echinostoma caproni]
MISVYETINHIYLVGSDADETRFRVLKIDRVPVPLDEESSLLECTGSGLCTATVEAESPFDRLWRLHIVEDPFVYSRSEIARLLHTIQAANRLSSPLNGSKSGEQSTESVGEGLPPSPRELQQAAASALHTGTGEPSLILSTKCDGLVGVIRFLRGYYLILITKSRLIAKIGEHKIFKVEDTTTIYIPGNDSSEVFVNMTNSRSRTTSMSKLGQDDGNGVLAPPGPFDTNSEWTQFCATASNRTRILAEEARYLKLLNSVDLGSNFYYSHTYDLSHTLQYNLNSVCCISWQFFLQNSFFH